jgi:phage N-6-adenine-methyltransferase
MGLVRSTTPQGVRDNWRTPPETFDYLNKRYGPFTLDAAADASNHLCGLWFGPHGALEDALGGSWAINGNTQHRVFCNPPYTMTWAFVMKAREEVEAGHCISATLLLPATTDVKWFHEAVWAGDRPREGVTVEFSKGRIRFLRPDGSKAGTPTHGSMFVTFRG